MSPDIEKIKDVIATAEEHNALVTESAQRILCALLAAGEGSLGRQLALRATNGFKSPSVNDDIAGVAVDLADALAYTTREHAGFTITDWTREHLDSQKK